MKVLVVHNRYSQHTGEGAVFDAETDLLRGAVNVSTFVADNRHGTGGLRAIGVALSLPWSRRTHRDIGAVLDRERPDVVHFHNIFPLVTPSAYDACRERGVPVVQSHHNFRFWCAATSFFRDGAICEDCVTRGPWQAVRHACYRDSLLASAAVARMQVAVARNRTLVTRVTLHVATTEFSAAKLVALGLPADRVAVKPNFAPRPAAFRSAPGPRALFVGRLIPEKGAAVAVHAFRPLAPIGLDVIGDGPETERLSGLAAGADHIRLLGFLPLREVESHLLRSAFLVFPSLWYEMCPRILLDALARGVPVIASRIGGIPEIVRDGLNGLLVPPGDAGALAEAARRLSGDAALNRRLSECARTDVEARFSPERNLELLLDIYRKAIAVAAPPDAPPAGHAMPPQPAAVGSAGITPAPETP